MDLTKNQINMKTKNNFYTRLSLQIVAVFVTVMLASFIPDAVPEFFGDVSCEGRIAHESTNPYSKTYTGCSWGPDDVEHAPTYHWGWRHWVWMLMGIVLFIVQCVRIIDFIINSQNKEQ